MYYARRLLVEVHRQLHFWFHFCGRYVLNVWVHLAAQLGPNWKIRIRILEY